ncbi:unnamed protein product [Hymenolepis diminuta]|uniref:Uncharacterized protein n=1 Tax=Hymenolepis diminuta TaxID=6216 RepID=A0A564Z495_HYMDI|nr:unnamed protein product [Hymenolepis diminuta]
MCEVVNLIVTPGSRQINIVFPQVAHSRQSEKLSVPWMVVTEALLTWRCFGTSPVHTVPSFSYNRPVQLKHTYSYVLMRVLIQVMNINNLPINTHTQTFTYQTHLPLLPS